MNKSFRLSTLAGKRLCFVTASVVLVFLLIGSIQAVSPNPPTGGALLARGVDRTIDLSSFTGKTYLQAMQASGNGIFDKTDADDSAAVTIATADQIVSDVSQFDAKVSQQIFGMFKNGQTDFQAVMENIQGKSFSPQNIRAGVQPFISSSNLKPSARTNIAVDASADVALLASGSGTLVTIDSANYFYNV